MTKIEISPNNARGGGKTTKAKQDTFRNAVNIMMYLANRVGEIHAYGWENVRKEIEDAFAAVRKNTIEAFWREVFALPDEQKIALGFKYFEEGDTKMCIPIWIWECLPDDMLIDGKPKKELDNDTRFGCVWWWA